MDKGKRKTSEEPIFPICEGADNDYDDIDWGTVIGTFTVEEPVTGGRTAGGGTSRRHLYYAYVCPNERGEPHFHVFDKSGFHRDEMEKDGVHSCVGIARGAYFGHGPYSDYLGGETLAALDKFMGETRPEHCSDGGRTNFEHTIREWNDNNVVKLDPVHTRKPDYAAMARAEPAGESPFEVATVGWPVFDGVRYRLSVDG